MVLRERVFEPLGMADTAFSAAAGLDRFGAAYDLAPDGDGLVVWDPADGQWSTPPAFPSAAGGLVSTARDYLRVRPHAARRRTAPTSGERLLSRPSVELLSSDQLSDAQKADADFVLGDAVGALLGLRRRAS